MAGDGSGAYPSYATIAKESGLNRSTVIKHVKLAASAGLLRIDGRADDDGEQTSNLYTALMPVVAHRDHPSLPSRPPLVAQDDPKNPSLTTQLSDPSLSPQPTKASRRGSTAAIRLEEFLSNFGGLPPFEWGEWARTELGWDADRFQREWVDFHDYWTSGNAVSGGLKRDWPATWRSSCRRSANRGGGRASSNNLDRGLAGAMRSSVAQRYGAAQPGGGVGGGTSANQTEPLRAGESVVVPAGEIPF